MPRIPTWAKVVAGGVALSAVGYLLYKVSNESFWKSHLIELPLKDRLQSQFPELDLDSARLVLIDPIPFSDWAFGVTLGDYIFVSPSNWEGMSESERLKFLAHELTHVVQWRRWGLLYPSLYTSALWMPWEDRPFEREALVRESEVMLA